MKKGAGVKRVIPLLILSLLLVSIFAVFALTSFVTADTIKYNSAGEKLTIHADGGWDIIDKDSQIVDAGTPGSSYPSSFNLDSAPIAGSSATKSVFCDSLSSPWKERCALWLGGPSGMGEGDLTLVGQLIKWIILILIIMIIYSALHTIELPSNTPLQIIISIVLGFLVTFFITTNELLTLMQGFSTLGIAIAVFIPFIVLAAISVMVAKSLSPIGIYVQKILWVIYTVYLLIKTFTLWGLMNADAGVVNNAATTNSTVQIWGFYHYPVDKATALLVQHADKGVLVMLVIVSLVSLAIMLSNKVVLAWFAKEELDAAIQSEKNKISKSNAYDALRAEELDKNKKV